jgi:triphosphoribosyl-dephospho-CoA synthase
VTLGSLRHRLLDARDARAATIARLSGALPDGRALVFLSLNVPGPEKTSARLDRLFARARTALTAMRAGPKACSTAADPAATAAESTGPVRGGPSGVPAVVAEGRDALGPWTAVSCAGPAAAVKRRTVAIEETLAAGRLVDLDVFETGGLPVDRASLGLPRRRCLACEEAAVDCMRTLRHSREELARLVARLLHASECEHLAEALVQGARIELDLTPKPGLVDRRDNGSHPDLTFELMSRSIDLLPEYYEELLGLLATRELRPAIDDATLGECVAAGLRAEQRMAKAIGTNAHRGYIFLSGLVLLGFAQRGECRMPGAGGSGGSARLRESIAALARRIVKAGHAAAPTHGGRVRQRHGVRGILGEALNGLPAIFDHALPALERAESRVGPTEAARHDAMATLMTVVEDTTTLHRGGAEGLERLRKDGQRILAAIDTSADYVPLLEQLNAEYRAVGLTMGGVADCLAIAVGLRLADLDEPCQNLNPTDTGRKLAEPFLESPDALVYFGP